MPKAIRYIYTLLIFPLLLSAQSIEEKRASLTQTSPGLQGEARERLTELNEELALHRTRLNELFQEVEALYDQHGSEEQYRSLLYQINEERHHVRELQTEWREWTTGRGTEEQYALWHQPWTTLEQLIMDYGSQDYVYLIPPEVRNLQVSLTSNLPIPRESWDEMLGLILAHNGVSIRQLNPFLRELYLTNLEQSDISYITDSREELRFIPARSRVCFVLTPSHSDVTTISEFLRRFIDTNTSAVYPTGNQFFMISSVEGIQQMLKLYDFIEASGGKREYALIPLNRIDANEMASILDLYFRNNCTDSDYCEYEPTSGGPRIMALPNLSSSLFVAGTEKEVAQAQQICADLESQVENPRAMTIHWYRCKHSEPEQLANILAQVYGLMIEEPIETPVTVIEGGGGTEKRLPGQCPTMPCVPTYDPAMIAVQPSPVTTRQPELLNGMPSRIGNFIVDPKTGTIIMVVYQQALPELKALLRRLDIPKKMVQIDVLLVEKKIKCESRFGLDLLHIGDNATNKNSLAIDWENIGGKKNFGILSFFFSQAKTHHLPAYDILYNFLMAQEDMRINANPSVTTVNHTPATIRLVEEISLDMGTFIDPDGRSTVLGSSFTRAQYGITLNITPTINQGVEEDGCMSPCYITLDTDVLFDTPQQQRHDKDRPRVLRRQINNQVRIEDGQTVVLGGLRSKMAEDSSTGLPFLGELPGIGKFFSSTRMKDDSTEMFIFITPHIVHDAEDDMQEFLCRRLYERPGDLPEFLRCLEEARCYQRQCTFCRSMQILFGQPKNHFCCQ